MTKVKIITGSHQEVEDKLNYLLEKEHDVRIIDMTSTDSGVNVLIEICSTSNL